MAEKNFSTSNSKITGKINYSVSSQNQANNTSNVRVIISYKRDNDGYTTLGYYSGTLKCDSQTATVSGTHITLSGGNWVTVFDKTFTVKHNADGKKSITITISGGLTEGTFTSSSGTVTFSPANIPRNPTIKTLTAGTPTNHSIPFNWTTNQTIGKRSYRVQKAGTWSSWTTWTAAGYSGKTYTDIANFLEPNTKYTIQFSIASVYGSTDCWSSYVNVSATTKDVPSITNSSVNFTIGAASITLNINNPCNNTFSIKLMSNNTTIDTKTGLTGTSYTWTFTDAQKTSLYDLTKRSTSVAISFVVSTTLNKGNNSAGNAVTATYTRTKNGVASIDTSDCKPSIPAISISSSNTDINTKLDIPNSAVLDKTTYLKLSIDTPSVAKNSAFISGYTAFMKDDTGKIIQTKNLSATAKNVIFDTTSVNITTSKVYKYELYATDSRGIKSSSNTGEFRIFSYYKPALNVVMKRVNNFNKEVTLSVIGYINPINYDGVNKNSFSALKYRVAEAGNAYPSAYSTISPTITSGSDQIAITYTKNESSPFTTLDQAKSYNIEFALEDKVSTGSDATVVTVNVSQGIAAITFLDNGKLAFNISPEIAGISLHVGGGGKINGGLIVDGYDVVSNLQSLSNASLPKRSTVTNYNDATNQGMYYINDSGTATSNGPTIGTTKAITKGIMQVSKYINGSEELITQIATSLSDGAIGGDAYIRSGVKGSLSSWKALTGPEIIKNGNGTSFKFPSGLCITTYNVENLGTFDVTTKYGNAYYCTTTVGRFTLPVKMKDGGFLFSTGELNGGWGWLERSVRSGLEVSTGYYIYSSASQSQRVVQGANFIEVYMWK